ncbi:membrane protein insertase YidC [Spiribacter aquaticus]|uniref:Membrane protein insertase YidC n=2 Tax=Ectothiorhodospiraceae TaxID=72276 RepID=A0A557RNI0_9GAMM|nr:membrane protein insertase YidC [Spiribacter aquaticus]KAF0279350.1 membrane protein insertase YidC [Spiribacter roseus]TVO66737.1 membrane protein insertase YidC [Spiribacter aquaticus]
MDNQRLFLVGALALVLLLIWTTWQRDYSTPPPQAESTEAASDSSAPAPAAEAPEAAADPQPADAPAREPGAEGDDPTRTDGDVIRVETDTLLVQIPLQGGNIVQARLPRHSVSEDNPAPYTLLSPNDPLFMAQSGLVSDEGSAPDHRARWSAGAERYVLEDGQDRLEVPLTWSNGDGVEVMRTYIFERDSYVVRMVQSVENTSDTPWRAYQYNQLRRSSETEGPGFLGAASYTGGVIYSPSEKYEKISFGDMEDSNLSRDIDNGWLAMIQHYFLASWVPPRDRELRYYSRFENGEYVLGQSSSWQTAEPGETVSFENRLFAGPKEQSRLDAVAEGLELTVDYGWLTIISKPLFIALSWIHGVVGNWGWSIILLTLGIKLVFYKLSETSYRSMARMRKLQPEMQKLRERYSEDRQQMNQELMQLYKKEKVNPLGGCLPILIQIPVFIALYWVLLESVELRQAPWILWIQDLSVRDPFYVLPLLMGASMFLQQKLNPAPMDPIQQKIMMGLPFVFTIFFMFFPAGLVLYWVTNNSLSILQQWFITRQIEAGDKKANA